MTDLFTEGILFNFDFAGFVISNGTLAVASSSSEGIILAPSGRPRLCPLKIGHDEIIGQEKADVLLVPEYTRPKSLQVNT